MSNNMFKHQLNPEELARVHAEYNRKRKHPLTAWLLLYVCGLIGGHRYYLEDYTGGILRGVFTLTLAAAVYAANRLIDLDVHIFITGTLLLLATLFLIDAAILPVKIRQVNNRIEADIIIKVSQRTRAQAINETYNWQEQKNTGS